VKGDIGPSPNWAEFGISEEDVFSVGPWAQYKNSYQQENEKKFCALKIDL
jgi:hypothetical protein